MQLAFKLVIAFAAACFVLTLAPARTALADEPFGIDVRVPWTSSHVHGSPEPPMPFRAQRAYPKLTFKSPLDVAFDANSHRVFIVEQAARIYSFVDNPSVDHADLLADLPAQVLNLEKVKYCQGINAAYGIAVDPDFATNRYIYVSYVMDIHWPPNAGPMTPKNQEGSRVSRFTLTPGNPPRIDPKSELVLISWFGGGHNGGCLKFGPDHDLYISTGDGGDPDPPDPFNTGQDISDLLCSILRIDVRHPGPDGKPYSIPGDNPFIKTPGARPEVFAYGVRNPWRMSFDRATGNLWVGDVGWELWESIFCVKAGTNCGWSIMEGPNPVHPNGVRGPTPLTKPQFSLSHAEACSITGGFVYHGSKLKSLTGQYLFGDWQTSRVWAAPCKGDQLEPYKQIAQTDLHVVAFGEKPNGEPLVVDHGGGGLWDLVPNESAAKTSDFPRKLSETGIFSKLNPPVPAAGVIPFSVKAPQWLDGATAERFVATPNSEAVFWGKGVWGDDRVAWPKDSVLTRTLMLEGRRVETQLLHYDGLQWQAYTYAWNDEQTDAELVPAGGSQKLVKIADASAPGGTRKKLYQYQSRAQCLTCHNVWCNFTLGFDLPQLDREQDFNGVRDNEIHTFQHLGLLTSTSPPSGGPPSILPPPSLVDPQDASAPLEKRARSYLAVNCSACHRFGGGGSALFDVRAELPDDQLHLINAKPNLGGFGIDDARLVCPGDPNRSVIVYRMSKLGRGRMPHIGSDVVDVAGVGLIRQWIEGIGRKNEPSPDELALIHATAPEKTNEIIQRLLASTSGSLSLLNDVEQHKLAPPVEALARAQGIATAQETSRDLFRSFDPTADSVERVGTNPDMTQLLARKGDPARGREVFFVAGGEGLCARCHKIDNTGGDFGPDLSHIATKYSQHDLLDNILNPSKTIAEGYTTYVVRTKAGDLLTGLIVERTNDHLAIRDAQLKTTKVALADVDRIAAQTISSMPDGILADLTPDQAADLLAYLGQRK